MMATLIDAPVKTVRKSTWVAPSQCAKVASFDGDLPSHVTKGDTWAKPRKSRFGPKTADYPTIHASQQKKDDDLLRLASMALSRTSVQSRSPSTIPRPRLARAPTPMKMGAKPYLAQKKEEKTDRHSQYKAARASGKEETEREKRGREDNEARSVVFKKQETTAHLCHADKAKARGLVKTCPCSFVLQGKTCPHAHCRFAHTPDELQVRMCHFGDRCRCKHKCPHAHTEHEAKVKLAIARAKFKAALQK